MKKTADPGSIEADKIGLYPNADGDMCIKDEDGNVKVLATTDDIPPEPTIPTDINELSDEDGLLKTDINQLTDEDTLLKMEDDNFTDWFLPSAAEIEQMAQNLYEEGVGDFLEERYWMSSEVNATTAGYYEFGVDHGTATKDNVYHIRPARKFTSETIYSLRDTGPAGGLIFYIDDSGAEPVYYEAASADIADAAWSNIVNAAIGTTGADIGDGTANTAAIIAQTGHTDSGAKLCSDYVVDLDLVRPKEGKISERHILYDNIHLSGRHEVIKGLKDNSLLKINKIYKVTDFKTIYNQPVTEELMEADNYEPLLLLAVSNNQFSPIAISTLYPKDIIYYDIDNVLTEMGDGARPGIIERRINTHQKIDITYDYLNVKFRRYACNQTLWSAGTYAKNTIRRIADDGVYVSLEDSNSDNPTSSVKWAKVLNLSVTNYWGYTSGDINGISFDANDYIDVYTFNDLSNSDNATGLNPNGYGISDVYINSTFNKNAKYWGAEINNRYMNNVFHWLGGNDDDYAGYQIGNIKLMNGFNFNEGDEIILNNTFLNANNVEIRGGFFNNAISENFFDIKKLHEHSTIKNNYFREFAQIQILPQSQINSCKIAIFNNNFIANGGIAYAKMNTLSKCEITNQLPGNIVINEIKYIKLLYGLNPLEPTVITDFSKFNTNYSKEIVITKDNQYALRYIDATGTQIIEIIS